MYLIWYDMCLFEAKQKYWGSGEIGLDIRTHAIPNVGQDQVSGGVSVRVPCRHATPVANALWKPIFNNNNVKVGKKSNQGKVL